MLVKGRDCGFVVDGIGFEICYLMGEVGGGCE